MNSIAKDQNNLGGIAKIWLIPSSLISSLLFDFPFSSPALLDGWQNDAWSFIPIFQSSSFTQSQEDSSAGTFWENTVTFSIPKITYDSRIFTSAVAFGKWAVLLLTENNQYLLIGSAENPMRGITKSTSGRDLADLNNIVVTVTGKTTILPVFIDSPL